MQSHGGADDTFAPVMLDRDGGSGVGDDFSADGKDLFFTGSRPTAPSCGSSTATGYFQP